MEVLARLELADGDSILLEVPDAAGGPVRAGDTVRDLPGSAQELLRPVREFARLALAELRQASPDEVEIEFGVKLGSRAGVVLAHGSATAHLRVSHRQLRRPGPALAHRHRHARGRHLKLQ